MNRGSIRLRLAAWYLAVLMSGLIVFGLSIWVALRHEMLNSVDDALGARTAGLAQFLDRESHGPDLPSVLEEAREYASGLPAGHALRLFAPDGALVFASPLPPGANVRIRREEIAVHGHSLTVEFSAPLHDVDEALSSLRNVLLGLIPMVLFAAGAGGWWLSRTALAPVDEMTAAAESISLHDLSARLAVPRTKDELERLGEAWNRMIGRLSISVHKMTQFTADAAHELRTPVAIIRGTAELALRRERDSSAYRTALANIEEEARYLSLLVEELMWLARNDAGSLNYSFEDVPIAELIADVCAAVRPLAEAGEAMLTTDLDFDARQTVRADRMALRRVLLILADNAIKFTPAGGTVVIRALADGEHCLVEVEDSGAGITTEELPFIFDRFYPGDRARNSSGFGLGLSIAKAVVEAHGGHVEVRSNTGQGSCFRVDLPSGRPAAAVIEAGMHANLTRA